MAASERGLEVLGVGGNLRRATLALQVVGPLARCWPRPDVRKARLERLVHGANEELLVAVGPHAQVTLWEQLELLVQLAEIGTGFFWAAELLARLLRLADDDALDVLVACVLSVAHDRDVPRLPALPCGRESVPDLDIGAVEAVALQELANDLLHQSVLRRGRDRLPREDVDEGLGFALRFLFGLAFDLLVELVGHVPGSTCSRRKAR